MNETSSYKTTPLELEMVIDNDANEFLEFMAKKIQSYSYENRVG